MAILYSFMVLNYNQRLHSPFGPKKKEKTKAKQNEQQIPEEQKITKNAFINLNLEGVGVLGRHLTSFAFSGF